MKLTGFHNKPLTDGQSSRLEYLFSKLRYDRSPEELQQLDRAFDFAIAVGRYVFEAEAEAQEAIRCLNLWDPPTQETNVPEPS